MNKLTNYNEIQNTIKLVKENSKGFITNFYSEPEKIKHWIENGQFHKMIIGNTVFFLKEEIEFSRLFYYSSSKEALNNSLSKFNSFIGNTLFVADVIGKESEVQSIAQVFNENGFYLYTTLNRMSRGTTKNDLKKPFAIKNSEIEHSAAIFTLLHQYFDPIAEQLPTKDEIGNWIKLNHLFLIEERGKILGFVIFDLIGVTAYLRYWFVHPQHRNNKCGSTLLNEFFTRTAETKRQLFWVIQSNDNAISRYIHYGFKNENLFDYVITNKNIQYEAKNN